MQNVQPAGATSVLNGRALCHSVEAACLGVGLTVEREYKFGARVYGGRRVIDLLVTDPRSGKRLGIECKVQVRRGSMELKVYSTFADMEAWTALKGLIVFDGPGWSQGVEQALVARGHVRLQDLRQWLQFYFR